jgi:hypothetical protein
LIPHDKLRIVASFSKDVRGKIDFGGIMLLLKRFAALAACIAMLGLLSACAENAATPDTITALPPGSQASLKIANLTDEAAPGVVIADYDLQRILQRVKAEISGVHPDVWVPAGAPVAGATNVKIVITQYDEGNAFARAMLAGLGQIRMDGDVVFSDAATGQKIAEYKVSKDFAFGGLYGAVTKIEDVEKGFAKSVAQILETKQSAIMAQMRNG